MFTIFDLLKELNKSMNSYSSHVVAIGLSAGGIEPLNELIGELPKSINASIIVIQHLQRDFKSMAHLFLQKQTAMPVVPIENGIRLEVGKIYVLPENQMATYKQGCLWLRERGEKEKINRAIDILMNSMSKELGGMAISVVLSGRDGDGSKGSLHIGQQGGTTIAQLPETAEHPSMPEGAIEVGKASYSLTPKEIATLIVQTVMNKTTNMK